MIFNRTFLGLTLTCVCIAAGCANVLGLGSYSVEDSTDKVAKSGATSGGDSAVAGNGASTGGSGDTGGAPGGGAMSSGGSTIIAGTGNGGGNGGNGGSAGVTTAGTDSGGAAGVSGEAGMGGAPPVDCPGGCDDLNDCTDDSCVAGTCQHQPVSAGQSCANGHVCDDTGTCVRCRDTATGKAQDSGCPAGAPICTGTGLSATCTGCASDADCDDSNECTSEACTTGSCVFTPIAAGQACSTGVCNGTSSAEQCVVCVDDHAGAATDSGCGSATPICVSGANGPKCVACVDDASAPSVDSGCTTGSPVCDSTGTPTCYACIQNSDCANDGIMCTDEICTNHACTHVVNNAKCTSSGNVCKPNRCSATLDCQQVDITVSKPLITTSTSVGNGGFEDNPTMPKSANAAFWTEGGDFWIVLNCSGAGCTPNSNSTKTKPSSGSNLAWLGGENATAGQTTESDLNQLLTLPAGTVSLTVQADSNFQTASKAAGNKDSFQVRLMDDTYTQIGAPLYSSSAATAQLGGTHVWTTNGINVTQDVTAHAGQDVFISFWSSSDDTSYTDFFIDNVRVTATVCQ